MTPATVVDTDSLLQTIAVALVAAIGVTLIFSVAIRGAVRFREAERDGRDAAATAFGALTLTALVAAAAAIAFGIIVMASN